MIISEKMKKELLSLQQSIDKIIYNNSLTDIQLETFLKLFEKARYNILNEIKIYNNTTEFEYEKIKTIDNEYKSESLGDILKIYVPEVLPSYKNIKTHTHKRILTNIAEITKPFANKFQDAACIYVKIFDKILNWDVDNKYIKPIADGLVLSKVISDDNMDKMFYCVKGEFSEIPHTEIYVFDSKNISEFLENCCT